MDYSSREGMCTICLSPVVDEDNRRGKAQLICGHRFHLDCIGSEFNYRGEMKCPNCRVTENGEWRLIVDDNEDFEDGDDDPPPPSNHAHRVEFHIYPHLHSTVNNTSPMHREREASQQQSAPNRSSYSNIQFSRNNTNEPHPQFPPICPAFHYHHHTVMVSPSARHDLASNTRASAVPSPSTQPDFANSRRATASNILIADALLRTYGPPNNSSSTRVERVVLQDRVNPAGNATPWNNISSFPTTSRNNTSQFPAVSWNNTNSSYRWNENSSSSIEETTMPRECVTTEPEPSLIYRLEDDDGRNPLLELTLFTDPNEVQLVRDSEQYWPELQNEDRNDAQNESTNDATSSETLGSIDQMLI